jgi:hypothetical protein
MFKMGDPKEVTTEPKAAKVSRTNTASTEKAVDAQKKLPDPPAAEQAASILAAEKGAPSTPGELENENIRGISAPTTDYIGARDGESTEEPMSLEERVKFLELELQGQYDQVQEYYTLAQQFENKWKGTAKELIKMRQGQPGSYDKVDDDVLVQNWNHIRFLVRTLTNKYFKPHSTKSPARYINPPHLDPLKYLTPEYKKYSKLRALRPVLIQAYLLSKLLSQQSGARLLWAGPNADSFRSLSSALQPVPELHGVPRAIRDGVLPATEIATFQAWKANTAGLVCERVERAEVQKRIDGITSRLGSEVYAFATTGARDPKFQEDLREVVQRVVELDEVISRSRAIVLFQMWYWKHDRHSFECGPDMESEDGFEEARSGMNVELVVSPGLFKIGNGDGGGYESITRLSKGTVVCSATRERMEQSGRLK